MTAATARPQMHVRRDGGRRVFSTCRQCKARQLLVVSRLKKRMPAPARGTPCECCGEVAERLELARSKRKELELAKVWFKNDVEGVAHLFARQGAPHETLGPGTH